MRALFYNGVNSLIFSFLAIQEERNWDQKHDFLPFKKISAFSVNLMLK